MPSMSQGIHRGIDVALYHSDPCVQPSLTQSIAKVLIDRSPLHAKYAHPRLMPPEAVEDEAYSKSKAIGDAAHALMIGRGKDLAIGEFDSWRTKEAQSFKSDAIAEGATPILQEHYGDALEIVQHARKQLDEHAEHDAFTRGAGEVALIWKEGDLWLRCLVDWLHDDLRTVDDFKTTAMCVSEHALPMLAANAGWDVQAAMIERGLDALDPDNAGRRRFRFVAQEQDAPYALNVMVMTEAWMTMGRKRLQYAIDVWSHCIRNNDWFGYPKAAIAPEYPGYREKQWLEREIVRAADPVNTLAAG